MAKTGSADPCACRALLARLSSWFDFNTTIKGGTRAQDRPTCFSSWFEHQLPSLSEFSFGGVIGCEAWRKPVLPTRAPAFSARPTACLAVCGGQAEWESLKSSSAAEAPGSGSTSCFFAGSARTQGVIEQRSPSSTGAFLKPCHTCDSWLLAARRTQLFCFEYFLAFFHRLGVK